MKKFSFALFLLACVACHNSQKVAARINGQALYSTDIAAQLRIELSKYDDLNASDPYQQQVVRNQIVERMIMDRILLQEAKKRDIRVNPDDFFNFLSKQRLSQDEAKQHLENIGVTYDFWRRQQEQRLIIEKLIQQILAERLPIPSQEISNYYRANAKMFQVPARYHARQILLNDAATAEKILKLLKQGEDFSKVVKDYSQSPDKDKGGVMGWLSRSNAPDSFVDVLEKLKPGELSRVIKTEYGYHIFQLLDKTAARTKELAEVENEILQNLQGKDGTEILKSWLKDLRDHAKVEVNQSVLETISLKE